MILPLNESVSVNPAYLYAASESGGGGLPAGGFWGKPSARGSSLALIPVSAFIIQKFRSDCNDISYRKTAKSSGGTVFGRIQCDRYSAEHAPAASMSRCPNHASASCSVCGRKKSESAVASQHPERKSCVPELRASNSFTGKQEGNKISGGSTLCGAPAVPVIRLSAAFFKL